MTAADLWDPTPGPTLNDFVDSLAYLQGDGRDEFIANTVKILGRSSPPTLEVARRSVLVVGEIQSGKTASFTALSALARDNSYPLIILLAGTKRPLLMQTVDRLMEDLRVDAAGALPEWQVVMTPKKSDFASIKESLETWSDPTWPTQYRRGVIVTALKTGGSLNKLRNLAKWLSSEGVNVPTLIIDDEADQAGLNLRAAQNEQSSTYEAILKLRDAVASHTFIMYTATPGANLLIELQDRLSPDTVVVLDSGHSYVGGADLFGVGSTFFRPIPASEISNATSPVPLDGPPATLKQCLAYFFVALTIAQARKPGTKPLSMLIHPASEKAVHEAYRQWVKAILALWESQFTEDPDFVDLLKFEFGTAIDEISRTVDITKVFANESNPKKHIMEMVRFWIRNIELRVINSAPGQIDIRPADWDQKPGWIVIGGNKLERGFTIKNLAVTYMPRGTGINAVDTIQQRGRFFGHKRAYVDLLRGWLNADTRESFTKNVETESALRASLKRIDDEGLPLKEWRRELFLGSNMVPTRAAVMTMNTARFDFKEGWRFRQQLLFDPPLGHLHSEAFSLIESWLKRSTLYPLDTRSIKPDSMHHVVNVPANDLIEILANWPMHEEDRVKLDHLLLGLRHYARLQEHLDTHLVFMDNLEPRFRSRDKRDPQPDLRWWRIENLHVGRSANYAGDQYMRTNDAITVQVHNVIPRTAPGESPVRNPVLAIALAWPIGFERSIVRQQL